MRGRIDLSDVDFETCNQEQIQHIGRVQPHGFLLLGDREGRIKAYSRNFVSLVGEAETIDGRPLADFGIDARSQALTHVEFGGRTFDVIAKHERDQIVVDCQPTIVNEDGWTIAADLRTILADLNLAGAFEEAGDVVARAVRRLTGVDRVVIYRFLPDWSGEVVAEARCDTIKSFMGLRFPAHDVPEPARRAYARVPVRVIADVETEEVALVPHEDPLTGAPFDIGGSVLRGVSLLHIQYLRNIGVRSSFSVSLKTDDAKLWGLIACHHRSSHVLSLAKVAALEVVGMEYAHRIAQITRLSVASTRERIKTVQFSILNGVATGSRLTGMLAQHTLEIQRFTQADGLAILGPDLLLTSGATPAETEIREIAGLLRARSAEYGAMFATDTLSDVVPQAKHYSAVASGLLAVSLSPHRKSMLLWFRRAARQKARWAGRPGAVGEDSTASRLTPRRSFAIWTEEHGGRSDRWTDTDLANAENVHALIVDGIMERVLEVDEIGARLERERQELENSTALLAHDLRAPLRGMALAIETLEEDAGDRLDDEQRELIGMIGKRARKLQTMLDELLDLAQAARESEAAEETSNLREVIDEALDIVSPPETCKIDIEHFEIALKIRRPILRHVLINLIGNAILHHDRDQTRIQIATQLFNNGCIVRVRDDGPGIPDDLQKAAFQPFRSLNVSARGHGIGLAYVRRYIEMSGGRVWLEEGLDGRGLGVAFLLGTRTHAITA